MPPIDPTRALAAPIQGVSSGATPAISPVEALLLGSEPRRGCRPEQTHPPSNSNSQILDFQLQELLSWGVIKPTQTARMIDKVFLVPKRDGRLARALYDARPQNALINWCSVSEHGRFNLLRPLHHVTVGLALRSARPYLAEIDLRSFFFQFSWSRQLADAHSFRALGQDYAFVVPVQGSALLPLVAQATTAVLAEAPPIRAHPWKWVRAGLAIVYDNILLAGEEDDVRKRWARIHERCSAVGVVIGDTQPPSRRVHSCGFEFDVEDTDDRKWRLSAAWVTRTLEWIGGEFDMTTAEDRLVMAGLVVWAMNATLRPLALVRRTVEGFWDEMEHAAVVQLLRENGWRRLRSPPTESVPTAAHVVITDASLDGAGIVTGGRAYAIRWPKKRSMEEQQMSEWDAAALGVEQAIRQSAPGTAILLVADNSGLLAGLISGNPASPRAAQIIRRMHASISGPLWCAHVPTSLNPADRPSRAQPGVTPVEWPHPLENKWRRSAILATWSMARR